jgi:DNA processing protein
MDEPKDWLTLARAPGLHAGHLATLGSGSLRPADLLRQSRPALAALGLGEASIEALTNPDAAGLAADARWLAGPDRRLVTWGSHDYPPLLASIPDPPLVLFVEGDATALALPQLAIVGSRNPTPLGRDTARQFAGHLAGAGLAITSGLALGIDAAGHRGALQAGGRTIAVLGCGLDAIYPREHSGLAAEQGREVFAIPGSIHNPMARGCHRLIRQGAKLVETADDIFTELGALLGGLRLAAHSEATDAQRVSARELDKDYEILLDALGFAPAGIDTLVARTGFATDAVASMLLILELDGRVAQQPGGLYCRRLTGK